MAHYSVGSDDVRAGIVRTLGDSLATWLVTHITNSDMEFKPYMADS
jgi:hemerythrin